MNRFFERQPANSTAPALRHWVLGMVVVALFAIASSAMAAPTTLSGRVIAVIDGDTIDILEDNYRPHRIRFAWTDAPESKQAFGQVAKRALGALVYAKRVTVQVFKEDRYDSKYGKRLIGSVFVDGNDVGLAMVAIGAVWHYEPVSVDQAPADRALYAAAMQKARQQHFGLWQDASPTPPWLWRREQAARDDQEKAPPTAAQFPTPRPRLRF